MPSVLQKDPHPHHTRPSLYKYISQLQYWQQTIFSHQENTITSIRKTVKRCWEDDIISSVLPDPFSPCLINLRRRIIDCNLFSLLHSLFCSTQNYCWGPPPVFVKHTKDRLCVCVCLKLGGDHNVVLPVSQQWSEKLWYTDVLTVLKLASAGRII